MATTKKPESNAAPRRAAFKLIRNPDGSIDREYQFEEGPPVLIPHIEALETVSKQKSYVIANLLRERDEAKEKAARRSREIKQQQEATNLAAVRKAFKALSATQRGRDATALVVKKTGLKPDAVRKHLKTIRQEQKPDQAG